MRSTVWTCALLYFSMVAIVQAENWGHWRGPTGNGGTLQAKPPLQWSSQKNVRWKVELPGLGSSSPIVWNQQVFVTTAVPVNKSSKDKMTELEFKLLCFDRANGKLQWEENGRSSQTTSRDSLDQRICFCLSLHRRRTCVCLLRLTRFVLLHDEG